jgi:tetratricopeptide (TPR) repeat protein
VSAARDLLAVLARGHEGVLECPSARLGWPFIAEHDLWFHRAFRAPELRAMLARAEARDDARSLAARGRLRRLLGDDAGAACDLRAALDAAPRLAQAHAWLAELDLSAPGAEEGLTRALSLPGAPGAALLYRAFARLQRGRPSDALKDAAAYRRRDPRSALAALLAGEAAWRLKRRDAAARAFADAARLEPVCAAAWLLRARAAAGGLPAALPPKAAALAERALDADPTYALITLSWHGPRARPGAAWRRHLGRLLDFAFREPERAGWYYRQDDIHYAPYHFQEYADARALLAIRPDAAWAEALTARGALRCPPDPALAKEGVRHATRAASLAPWAGWPRAWIGLGLIKSRKPKEAERFFTQCLRLQPFYHRALAWRGSLRRGLGRTEQAIADLDRAIAIDELYPFAPHERSLARRAQGDWLGAALDLDRAFLLDWRYSWVFASGREPGAEESARGLRELDAAVARHPSCVSLRAWRGELRRARGELGRALADLFEAAAQDPSHPNALAFLGRALLEAGRPAEALEPLARAIALAPGQWIFRGWLAEAEFRAGRRQRAFSQIAEIIRGTPQHWWALHLRARFQLESGRPRRALADLERADSYEGRHADGHHLAAQALVALGDLPGAEAETDKALRVSPHLGRALLLRAEIRRRQGRAAEALADWKTVFEKFPYLLNPEERGRVRALLGA